MKTPTIHLSPLLHYSISPLLKNHTQSLFPFFFAVTKDFTYICIFVTARSDTGLYPHVRPPEIITKVVYKHTTMNREEDIRQAVETMKKGGVILYPTDTVWGIGCDATNEKAVAKVYEIKRRADSKAMICLTDSDVRLQRYVRNAPEVAWNILELATKPTTVIFDEAFNLAPNLKAEDGSVAIRITREPFSKELCYRFQKPIVSTSANISGEPTAQNYRDISEEIINAVDYVCFSRRQEKEPHTPSSIIRIRQNGEMEIIRK